MSPDWRKSSFSAANGNCVQFARLPDGRCVLRDSKDPTGPVLTFSAADWTTFLSNVRHNPADYWPQPQPETREQVDEAAAGCMAEVLRNPPDAPGARRLPPPWVDEDPPI